MAEKNRSGARETPLSCQAARLRRRQELENTPMARISPQADDPRPEDGPLGSAELCALLEAQNRLLCDILGAVTSLTAAHLAASQAKGE